MEWTISWEVEREESKQSCDMQRNPLMSELDWEEGEAKNEMCNENSVLWIRKGGQESINEKCDMQRKFPSKELNWKMGKK